MAKPEEVERKWWLVDATDKTVGRLATEITNKLRGKNKPQYTPHVDTGDFVVVINSDKVRFSSPKKFDDKKYYSHSRFFGSLKEVTAKEQLEKDSTEIIKKAVKGMFPGNKLGKQQLSKLKVYVDANHPHTAQKPESLNI